MSTLRNYIKSSRFVKANVVLVNPWLKRAYKISNFVIVIVKKNIVIHIEICTQYYKFLTSSSNNNSNLQQLLHMYLSYHTVSQVCSEYSKVTMYVTTFDIPNFNV